MNDTRAIALRKIKLLVSLAQIDGAVAKAEVQFIIRIGAAMGLKESDIEPLFERVHALVLPGDLSHEEKFDHLLLMVQVMKSDEKMFKEELLFCRKLAVHLGYTEQALFDLLLHATPAEMTESEVSTLRESINKYLQ